MLYYHADEKRIQPPLTHDVSFSFSAATVSTSMTQHNTRQLLMRKLPRSAPP